MKKSILLLIIILLTSCASKEKDQETIDRLQTFKVYVVFENGISDTLILKGREQPHLFKQSKKHKTELRIYQPKSSIPKTVAYDVLYITHIED